MHKAELLLYLFDIRSTSPIDLAKELKLLPAMEQTILVANKTEETNHSTEDWPEKTIFISAKTKNIEPLIQELKRLASHYELGNETVVNNARHLDALDKSSGALQKVLSGLDTGLTSDMIALDIRHALYQLGIITGEVTNDEVLNSIFTRFCIGK